MRRLLVVALLLAACGSKAEAAPSSPPATVAVAMTAGDYWDAHPSDLHKFCAGFTVLAEFVGWPNEIAYRSFRKSWTKDDYRPGPNDPPSVDVFAEAIDRCGL